jgi:hypothetical protein
MKTHNVDILKSKQTSAILGLLTLVVIVTLAPHAFAQQQGIPLGGPYGTPQPTDQGQALGWGVGMVTAAVVTGVGMWSIVKRR